MNNRCFNVGTKDLADFPPTTMTLDTSGAWYLSAAAHTSSLPSMLHYSLGFFHLFSPQMSFLPHWKASASKAAAAASASAAHLRSPTTKIFKKGAPIDKKGRKKSVCKSCEHLCSAIPLALSLSLSLSLSSSLSNTLNLSLFLTYLSFCALS